MRFLEKRHYPRWDKDQLLLKLLEVEDVDLVSVLGQSNPRRPDLGAAQLADRKTVPDRGRETDGAQPRQFLDDDHVLNPLESGGGLSKGRLVALRTHDST